MKRTLPLSSPRCGLYFTALTLILALANVGHSQDLVITPEAIDGIFPSGQPVRWTLELRGAEAASADFVVRRGGLTEVAQGHTQLIDGRGHLEMQLDEPGWLLVEASARTPEGRTINGGHMFKGTYV